jgi:hypothetical protein
VTNKRSNKLSNWEGNNSEQGQKDRKKKKKEGWGGGRLHDDRRASLFVKTVTRVSSSPSVR